MKTRLPLAGLLGLLTLLRWAWSASRDITSQEAYLALCGFTPAPAYFDGPPGTPLCVATGIHLAGVNGLGAALLWPVFALLAGFSLYGLAAPLAGSSRAAGLVVLLNALPLFNHAALTPSSAMPLAMFGLAFMASAWRALDRDSLLWWLAAGLCAAGGLAFGYLAWFFFPALAFVLLASRRWRPEMLSAGLWLAALPAILVAASLVAWNAGHGWVHFIGGTWQTATAIEPSRAARAIADAGLALSPLVLVALLSALVLAAREMRSARKIKFLAVPAMAAWTIAAYIALRGLPAGSALLLAACLSLPLLGWLPAEGNAGDIMRAQTHRRRFVARMATLVAGIVRSPAFMRLVFLTAALTTGIWLAMHRAPAAEIDATVVAKIAGFQRSQASAEPLFLIAENAPLASAISLHLPNTEHAIAGHPSVYVVESPFADSQYALWPRYDQFAPAAEQAQEETGPDPFTEQGGVNRFIGRSALCITTQAPDQLPQTITAAFADHRLLGEIGLPTGRVLRVYLCSDYQTLPL